MSEPVRKTVVGACNEISEKNGWTNFVVESPDLQYPVRLSTKLPKLVEEARAVGQQTAVWTYDESEGGPNPNRPGTNYMNRRLQTVTTNTDQAVSDQPASATTAAREQQPGTHKPVALGDKDRLIARESFYRTAAIFYQNRPEVDDSELFSLALRLELDAYRDIDDVPFRVDEQEAPEFDDIPFG